MGTSFGSIHHVCHQGFVVFTSTVCAPCHQAECVVFPTTIIESHSRLLVLCSAFSSHHLEYGFPSTHTTNSISIALFLYSRVHQLYFSESSISLTSYYVYLTAILLYAFSIVFGRIYAAMHSFTDCFCGIILGAAIWVLQHLYLERIVEAITNGSWIGESQDLVFSGGGGSTYTNLHDPIQFP